MYQTQVTHISKIKTLLKGLFVLIALALLLSIFWLYHAMQEMHVEQSQIFAQDQHAREFTARLSDDYLVPYWSKGTWFEHPLGFHNRWMSDTKYTDFPTRERHENKLKQGNAIGYDAATGKYNPSLDTFRRRGDRDTRDDGFIRYGFEFCMPSMSYLPRNQINSAPHLRSEACASEGEGIVSANYYVGFALRWAFSEGAEHSFYARRLLDDENALGEKRHFQFRDPALFENSKTGPITGEKDYFVHSDDGKIAVSFHCYKTVGLCNGWVWERSNDLIFKINLPFDQVQIENQPLWEAPVHRVVDLIKDWRLE